MSSRYKLRIRLKEVDYTTGSPPKKKVKKNDEPDYSKQRYRKAREHLLSDPIKYDDYKQKDAAKKRDYRRRLKDDAAKYANYKEKARLRMANLRDRRKHEPVKRLTRKDADERREKWRRDKAKSRARMSTQAKLRELENRRLRYAQNKVKRRLNFFEIPKTPGKTAEVILDNLQNSTPISKEVLKDKGIIFTPRSKKQAAEDRRIVMMLREHLKNVRKNKSRQGRTEYRSLVRALSQKSVKDIYVRDRLEVRAKFWRWATQYDDSEEDREFSRCDGLTEEELKDVEEAYMTNSDELSVKSTVVGDHQKFVLNKTLRELHSDYNKTASRKLSLSHFSKLKPKLVYTVDKQQFRLALCEYCINVETNLSALKRLAASNGRSCKHSKFTVAAMSVCGNETTMCRERICKNCSLNALRDSLYKEFDGLLDKKISWTKWKNAHTKPPRKSTAKESEKGQCKLVRFRCWKQVQSVIASVI